MAALKSGADLVYIFCHPSCAPTLKSYSPELIVQPCLVSSSSPSESLEGQALEGNLQGKVVPWLQKLHALIIGPGLSKDPWMLKSAELIMKEAIQRQIPLVLDADACSIFSLKNNISLENSIVVLTPNTREFDNLCEAFVRPQSK